MGFNRLVRCPIPIGGIFKRMVRCGIVLCGIARDGEVWCGIVRYVWYCEVPDPDRRNIQKLFHQFILSAR